MTLKNSTILITGASAGIGAACARQFAEQGARLILSARRLEKLQALQQSLNTDVHLLRMDVSDRDAVENHLQQLPAEWQNIDILVNNAGLAAGLDSIADANMDNWERMIDTNVKGLLYVTRQILPGMLQRQRGHIINIGSTAGRGVYSGGNVYCATKHAVRAINQAIKLECHGTPIRVSEIAPGLTETEFSLVRFDHDQQRANEVYQGYQPLHADDIANTVVYVAKAPAHVNISEMVVIPVAQSPNFDVARQ